MAVNLDLIRTTAQRVAASHGLDVVEIDYQGAGKSRALRIFIEKNAEERAKLAAQAAALDTGENSHAANVSREHLSGITHDDCQSFSRDFGTVLDVEDLVPGGEYTLEVSSPGLDRRLQGVEDFRRFAGSLVKVRTIEPVAGNRHWQGRLAQVSDHAIILDPSALKQKGKSKKASQEAFEIDVSNIEKANLVPEI
ncbi:MAG TPA: ribosome maturation factor RimP [Terracidiphilus sp.]|nr:ribosome maturation factor RimP [Terracidiphilus sp.]